MYEIQTLFVCGCRYEMRTPWDRTWGVFEDNGNWTGTVGTLQYDKADFSMILSWLSERFPYVEYTRVYVSEPLITVTLKAKALPQFLALARPFSGMDLILK